MGACLKGDSTDTAKGTEKDISRYNTQSITYTCTLYPAIITRSVVVACHSDNTELHDMLPHSTCYTAKPYALYQKKNKKKKNLNLLIDERATMLPAVGVRAGTSISARNSTHYTRPLGVSLTINTGYIRRLKTTPPSPLPQPASPTSITNRLLSNHIHNLPDKRDKN